METPRFYRLLGLAVTSLLSFTSSVEQTAFGECYVTMWGNQKRQPIGYCNFFPLKSYALKK